MRLESSLKYFIEKHIKLIDENDWDKFFDHAARNLSGSSVTALARTLEQAGVQPIDYMSYIPACYFQLSDVSAIKIPYNIRSIEQKAFYLSDLVSVVVTKNVHNIQQEAFCACYDLETVVLEEGVHHIDSYVFYMCSSLIKVTLPSTLEKLGEGVFSGCDTLEELTYNGTIEQWNKVDGHNDVNDGCPSLVEIHCSDGVIHLKDSK